MLGQKAPAEKGRIEERPVWMRNQGLVDHREVMRERVEAEMLGPGRAEVEEEHRARHRREESGAIQNGMQAAGPSADEESAIPTREGEQGERAVQDPGRLPEALEADRTESGQIERHQGEERQASHGDRDGREAKRSQHDGMMR